MKGYTNFLINLWSLARYNVRIIFGGRFLYFILAALIFFLLFGTIMAFEDNEIYLDDVYAVLAFPAVLLVFYPTAFGIQNDADQRTLEIIFGIPDYRYKVWLVRFAMVLVLVFVLLIPFAGLAYYALISFPLFKMIMHLMVLVFFASTVAFAFSTIFKNGNATAVVMVVLTLAFLILSEPLAESKWNILLNPYNTNISNELIWQSTVRENRLIMLGVSLVLLLMGLLNLQGREKFLS
ncbi:hypothetical protein ACFLT1_01605 [Bacteroidota bacterium]